MNFLESSMLHFVVSYILTITRKLNEGATLRNIISEEEKIFFGCDLFQCTQTQNCEACFVAFVQTSAFEDEAVRWIVCFSFIKFA
jgi:hypothetical protein